MGDRALEDLRGPIVPRDFGPPAAYLLGALLPLLVTVVSASLSSSYDFPFVFLYLLPLLIVAFLGGLLPATLSAILSTVLADYFFVDPPGVSLQKLEAGALPSLAFLLSGVLIAAAGNQYRLYQRRLREDRRKSQRREREDRLLIAVGDLLARRQETDRPYAEVAARIAAALGEWSVLVAGKADAMDLLGFAGAGPERPPPPSDLLASLTGPAAGWMRRVLEAEHATAVVRQRRRRARGDEVLMGWLARYRLAGALLAPLRIDGESPGVLAVLARRPRRWDADDLRVLEVLAARIARSLHRDRLADEAAAREREQAFLDELMVAFAAEVDLTTTLQEVARRCAEELGDWCGISLLDPQGGGLSLAAVHHRDPEKVRRVREIVAQTPTSPDNPMTARVLAGRDPVPVYADDPLVRELMPRWPILQEMFGRLGVRAVLYGPIAYRGAPLGTFSIGVESARRWEAGDLRLAAEVASRTGVAIQNARLREAERAARAHAERESARISAVSRAIAIAAATMDLGTVYEEFAESLQLLLPFTRVTVTLYDPEREWLTMPYFKGPELGAPRQRLEGPKAGTVRGLVLDTGRPYVRADTLEAHEFEEDEVLGGAGIRSYLVVPMSVGGRPVGTLNFGYMKPGFYNEEHARLIQPIADQLALTVEHARLLERQRRLADQLSETMQRALLPAVLPEVPFAALGALYRPADPEGKVGGDWYDALILSDDRVLIGVGDATGHGLAAASVTAQARHMIRAFALEGRQPAQILNGVNQVLWRLPETPQLSAWVATVDPFTGLLQHSSAGSPPPYLLAEGRVRQLASGGPPLGSSPGVEYGEDQETLAPGSRLVAYTDGLIEITRDLTEGERRLEEAVVATAGDPAAVAGEALVRRIVRGEEPHDDIALLLMDLLPEDAPLVFAMQASAANLRRVRRAVRALAARHGVAPPRAEEVVLAVGEAALNAVEHAYRGRPGRLALRGEASGETLTVSVRDFGQWRAPEGRPGGRGTGIMRGFSDALKISTSPAGTLVEMSWRLAERSAASP